MDVLQTAITKLESDAFAALRALNEASYAAIYANKHQSAKVGATLRQIASMTDNLVDDFKHEKEPA